MLTGNREGILLHILCILQALYLLTCDQVSFVAFSRDILSLYLLNALLWVT